MFLTTVFSGAASAWLAGFFHRAAAYLWKLLGRGREDAPRSPSAWLAGATHRWHTHSLFAATHDRVDGHSARVAILILQFSPNASAELLRAAIIHDLGEHAVGDMAAPVKRANPALYAEVSALELRAISELGFEGVYLSDLEKGYLKLCDGLDGYLWALLHRPDVVTTHPAWRDHLAGLQARADALSARAKFDEIVRGVSNGKF